MLSKLTLGSVCALVLVAAKPVQANSAPTIDPLSNEQVSVGEELRVRVVPRDADRQVPALIVENPPTNSAFPDNGDGTRTFTWRPENRDIGTRTVTFLATDALDQSLQERRNLVINVVGAGDNSNGPSSSISLDPIPDQVIQVGGQFDFRVVPRDPGRGVPNLTVEGLPSGASFDDNRDGTRQFRWQPAGSDSFQHTIVFVATDGSNSNRQARISVRLRRDTNVDDSGSSTDNNAPYFVGLYDPMVFLGNTLNIRIEAKDDDGDVPGLSIERLPEGATFRDNLDGTRTLSWVPYPIDLGETIVTFFAIDAKNPAIRTPASIRIQVARDPNNPVNFPPVINGIQNPLIRVGDRLTMKVQPVDPDFTVPTLEVLNPPPGSSFIDNGDGTRNFNWTVSWEHLGTTQVTFRAKDSEDPGLQFERTVTITVVDPVSLDRSGERLRVLAEQRNFLIGYAAVLESNKLADHQLYADIAASEFNMITPENSHKMGWIQPHRGYFRFDDADHLANFATEKGMVLHGHPLVWYAQLPGWVQNLDPSEAQSVMREHIQALVSRYRGKVAIWDVVNEALEDDGSLRNSIWYQGMGENYIRQAFQLADANDPNAVMIYNDYNVAWYNEKSNAMYELLKREREAGTPVDGVGFQMHLTTEFNQFGEVESNFQRFADLGLDIYITEFDVAVRGGGNETTQATIYRRILEICLRQPRCKATQAWGFTDRYSWRASEKPLLFTDSYQPKPSYFEWQRTLREFNR
ncbi:MAG: endo-1,4-beta-xylanase [Gammaproteobacteria bacterium]|nr:endo-1,4-beta-xylanase [Gammaproteobacteria bacterium]